MIGLVVGRREVVGGGWVADGVGGRHGHGEPGVDVAVLLVLLVLIVLLVGVVLLLVLELVVVLVVLRVAVLVSLAHSLQRRRLMDRRAGRVPIAVGVGRQACLDAGRVAVADALGRPASEPYGVVVRLRRGRGRGRGGGLLVTVAVVAAAGEDALDNLAGRSLLGRGGRLGPRG